MTFTTLTFLVFLTIVFSLYWLLRARSAQNTLLLLASYVFYGWWDWRFCSLMLISSIADFIIGLLLERTDNTIRRKLLVVASLTVNLGMLGFFKYFNFFAENFHALITSLGFEADPVTLRIILPVGISFYTFQTLSYTIDVYRKKLPATRRLIDYLAYVSFFPQLVAGPIERGAHLLPQFLKPRSFNLDLARDGLRQMLWGVFKKMVIADNLAVIVDAAYSDPGSNQGPMLFVATICFAFQIYADFSGYSDIAIGTARLFGIDLMRNFAYPYFSQSVSEFWRRWHISLSTWFRDYVYIPMGGSRAGPVRRVFNVMVTFIVSGLWHGASWNFVIWGGINGLGVVPSILKPNSVKQHASDTPGGESLIPSLPVIGRMLATFTLITLAWVFFRAETLQDSLFILRTIAMEVWQPILWQPVGTLFTDPVSKATMYHLVLLVVLEWVHRRNAHGLVPTVPRWLRWIAYTALIWDIIFYGTRTTSAFIYFQF